jgi:hypothetical protein
LAIVTLITGIAKLHGGNDLMFSHADGLGVAELGAGAADALRRHRHR